MDINFPQYPPGSVAWLTALYLRANILLAEAIELHRREGEKSPFVNDCVNWGDVNCTNAYLYIDMYGKSEATIEVSEAAPGLAPRLRDWMAERLAKQGYGTVHMNTEW